MDDEAAGARTMAQLVTTVTTVTNPRSASPKSRISRGRIASSFVAAGTAHSLQRLSQGLVS
jgi:hypothetical protein